MKTKNNFRFSKLPIQIQFSIISILAAILAVISMVLMLNSASKIEFENEVSHATLELEKSTNDLQTLITRLEVIADSFQSSDNAHSFLMADSYSDLSVDVVDALSEETSYLKCLYTEIADIAFVNNLVHWSSLYSESDLSSFYEEEKKDTSLLGQALGIKKSSFLTNSSKSYYVYSRHIYDNSVPIGSIYISIDLEKRSFSSIGDDEDTVFYLMDTLGNTYDIRKIDDIFETEVLPKCVSHLGSDTAGEIVSFSTDHYYTSLSFSPAAKCYIITAVSLDKVNEALTNTKRQLSMLSVLVILFIALLLWILYQNLIRPLQKFVSVIRKMEKEKKRHLKEPVEIGGCQQITDLSNSFTSLFSTIDDLNIKIFEASSKLYEEKIRGQETEISYFRSQINPHFLYNVLELVKTIAIQRDVPEIADIAIAMSKMYRYNTKGSNIVTFREELEMTKSYIDIQKYRFKDKFDVIFNIPEETLDIPVIKMILQPLVENSIGHGIEPSLHDCTLYIGASVTDKDFYIEVRDDGVGIEEDVLKEITNLLSLEKYDTSRYVGLANTNARIRLQYGIEYGISVESSNTDGTVVRVHLPYQKSCDRKVPTCTE